MESSVAFVLITCKKDSTSDIITQLKEISIVKEVCLVKGQWNIVVKFQSEELDDVRDTIRWKLRKMLEIESTLTLVEYLK